MFQGEEVVQELVKYLKGTVEIGNSDVPAESKVKERRKPKRISRS